MSRVALIGPVYPYRGGIAHHTTILAKTLQADHEVRVISFRQQYPGWLYPGHTDKDPSRLQLRFQGEYLLAPLAPWTWYQTAARIAEFSPAVTVIQWWTTFWAPGLGVVARLLRRRGQRTVFLVHNVLPHEQHPWDAALARFALRGGMAWVAQSESQKAQLESLVPGSKCEVCPHPVYPMFADRPIPREVARRQLGLPPNSKIVLFFGLVRPYKGLRYLIDAVARLHDRGQDVYLVVAGEFWENRQKYVAQINRMRLVDHARLDDRYIPNEDVGGYFFASDVLVAPYVAGSQSGVVQLAAGYGVPCVLTAHDALSIERRDALTLMVPPRSPDVLANAISEALAHPATSKQTNLGVDSGWRAFALSILQAGLVHGAAPIEGDGQAR